MAMQTCLLRILSGIAHSARVTAHQRQDLLTKDYTEHLQCIVETLLRSVLDSGLIHPACLLQVLHSCQVIRTERKFLNLIVTVLCARSHRMP